MMNNMDETIEALYHDNPSVYPLTAFPYIMKNAIKLLHKDCGLPMDMIGSVMLASASLACQSLIDVVLPYDKDNKGSCALYLLILAESGGRKSTVFSKVMRPFTQFSSTMKEDYKEKVKKYEDDLEEWNEYNKDLRSLMRKAKSSEEREDLREDIRKHREDKPVSPRPFHLRYGNTTEVSLYKGLMDYPYGAIITDEASGFFKGNLANLLDILNGIWDGAPQPFNRITKNVDSDIAAWMTVLLMVQPKIFDKVMSKNKNEARDNGFISRFLIDLQPRSEGVTPNLDYTESDAALDKYNNQIAELLNTQQKKFNSSDDSKITLHLSEDAKKLWLDKDGEIAKKRNKGQEWENIHDIASKASNNAIRIAAIFTRIIDDECKEISVKALENAYRIVEWHLRQANQLFFKDSPQDHFVQDVYAVFKWIKERFEKTNNSPILKTEITQGGVNGPRNLRRVSNLDPILDQLISLKKIVIIKNDNRSIHIVKTRVESYYDIYRGDIGQYLYIPLNLFPLNLNLNIFTYQNTKGKCSNDFFNPIHLQY